MKDRYCLPVIKRSKKDVLDTLDKFGENYGFFEVWLDYIEDFDTDFTVELIDKYPDRIILVLRRQNLEPIKMPFEERKKVLDTATSKNCLVDLDIVIQKEELNYLKSSGKDNNLICSYHNYDSTPAYDELEKTVNEMEAYSPGIIKLSTMCNSSDDALRLIKLKVKFLKNDRRHIVLGMGEEGKITRVFGALWGNALIFIPETEEEASAPGQITRQEFDKIMERIKRTD
ncbi:MAG TPA: type I 3-dehydroquinate dehydratase [Candidatus Saccharimonadales bacterium]|nr:type I 3-dehydroquinate dehydratase [Candidatus Saccharimonadales bacterium]